MSARQSARQSARRSARTPPPAHGWRAGLLAAALAGTCLLAAAQGANLKSSQLYEDALTRFEKKDYAGAVVQLKNALQIDRRQLPVQVLLGRALLANGEAIAAEVAFEEALKLGVNPAEVVVPLAEALSLQGKPEQLMQPKFAHTALPQGVKVKLLMLKAAAASDLGNTREALQWLDEARSLEAGSAESWVAEVPIRVRARQLKEAKAAADKAVALDPKSPEAAYQQATVAHVMGDLKLATTLYTRTIELKAGHTDALVARAGLYLDMGRPEDAAADVQAARRSSPRDPRAVYLASLLAERAGNTAEVKANLNLVANLLDPIPMEALRYRPQALMLGGLSHFGLAQYEKAKPYLEMVLRQDARSPVAKLLAQIYLRDKSPASMSRAIEALEAYLRNHPNDMQATMMLASAHMAQGRHARAAQLMQEALKKSDTPEARSMLGISLVGAGKLASGAAELEATIKRDPGQLEAGVTLAGLYLGTGQSARAVAVADGLVKRQPDNPGLQNLLGSALAAQGDAAGARAAFEKAVKLAPTFVDPRLNLARMDIDERKFDLAKGRLDPILAKNDKHVDALIEMARMASARGKPDEAERWLLRAEDHSGQNLAAGTQLIEFQLARGRPDLAREALKRLQAKAPEAFPVLLLQARVQLAAKDGAGAKTTLTRATTVANYDAAALAQVASLQLRAGDLAGAAHALDKALSERPDHLRARALMTEVELQRGELPKAEQRARAIVASEPKMGVGHALLGHVALARGQQAAAIDSFRKAHQIENTSESLLRLCGALEERDRPAAVALAEQWLRDHPTDAAVRRALANAQARSGNLAAARASYETLLKQKPDDVETLNNLANVMVLLKDPTAVRVAERALALSPESAHVIGTAGWAAFHAGQVDRGLQLLRDARLRDPNNADSRYFLGVALAQRGRKAEAREELEGALKSGRPFAYSRQAQELLLTLR